MEQLLEALQSNEAVVSRIVSFTDAESFEVLPANASREGFIIGNYTDAKLLLKFGDDCSNSDYSVELTAGQTYEPNLRVFTNAISGWYDTAPTSGQISLTEYQR